MLAGAMGARRFVLPRSEETVGADARAVADGHGSVDLQKVRRRSRRRLQRMLELRRRPAALPAGLIQPEENVMAGEKLHLLAFAGSLRRRSFNRGLIRAAVEVVPAGIEIETFDLAPIPLYNGDVEEQGLPQPVADFKDKIRAADALLIATPEYNYSIPGVLKNAIDWASRPPTPSPLQRKPVALMGASAG